MATFLKVFSGLYLSLIWLGAATVVAIPFPADHFAGGSGARALAVLIAATLSLPAVVVYAFAQVVSDVRQMRNHLRAMRKYYEPSE